MSGGERRMTAVARAMMLAPRVLLLDEPTAGLSAALTRKVLEEQARMLADRGTAVLLVEQKAHAALELADWAYVLVHGRVAFPRPAGRCSRIRTWARSSSAVAPRCPTARSRRDETTPPSARRAGPAAHRLESATMKGKIAVEEHFATAALQDLISGVGWSPDEWRGVLDRLCDTERRLAEMDRLGIEKAVLSLGSFGIQDVVDPAEALTRAVAANDALAEIVARSPSASPASPRFRCRTRGRGG